MRGSLVSYIDSFCAYGMQCSCSVWLPLLLITIIYLVVGRTSRPIVGCWKVTCEPKNCMLPSSKTFFCQNTSKTIINSTLSACLKQLRSKRHVWGLNANEPANPSLLALSLLSPPHYNVVCMACLSCVIMKCKQQMIKNKSINICRLNCDRNVINALLIQMIPFLFVVNIG